MPWKLPELIDLPNLQILMERFHAATAIPVGILISKGLANYRRTEVKKTLRESEEKFSKAFHTAPISMAISTMEGKFLEVSKMFERHTGYTSEEAIGQSSLELGLWCNPAERQNAVEILEREGEVRDLGFTLRTKHGALRSAVFYGIAINLHGEKLLLSLVNDITECKLAEETLRESEQRYKEIFENTSNCIFLLDVTTDGRFKFAEFNPAEEKAVGFSNAEICGRFIEDVIPEEIAKGPISHYRHCLEMGTSISYDEELRLPVGVRYFHTTLIPMRNAAGRIHRIIGVAHDITERTRVERALRESEEKFAKAFRANPSLLVISSIAEGRYFEVNETFELFSGYGREEVIGHTSLELNIWETPEARSRFFQMICKDGKVRDLEARFRCKSGDILLGLLSAEVIEIEGEQRLLILVNDITARKRAEEALHKAHDELELRVRERTAELEEANKALEAEISEREAAEKEVLRLNRLYAVLSMTNHTIVRAKERDRLFADICRGAVEQGGFRMAWIGLIDDESGLVEPVAWYGANNGYLDNIRISVARVPEGLGPTGSAIRDGRYCIFNNFLDDPHTRLWHEAGRERGFLSSAAIALTMNKKVIGALTIYAGEAHFFGSQMIELLGQMAMDISFALDNLDHEARHRKAELALHEEAMERLRTAENLREKERMLIQQSRQAAMGEMIGNIAHQWRQPLNNLGLIVQQLQLFSEYGNFSKDCLDSSVGKSMAIIQHMSRTIDDFRNFFKPDKEKVEFEALEEINKTISLIEGGLKAHGIKVKVAATDYPVIHGYPNEYSQVLLNILINARDAFVSRTIEGPKVTINLSSENGKTVVTITDNAGGIPDDIIHKIFDPYFTTKGPDKGTGVGLFLSKTIIEKNMNGTLAVRNTGDGAEFRIEL